jgi:hypothetical protein
MIQFPENPVEGQVFRGHVYHEAWDNGSGHMESAGWHPIAPSIENDPMWSRNELQFHEDMEMMHNYKEQQL